MALQVGSKNSAPAVSRDTLTICLTPLLTCPTCTINLFNLSAERLLQLCIIIALPLAISLRKRLRHATVNGWSRARSKELGASNVTNLIAKAVAPAVIEYHSMRLKSRSRFLLMQRRVHDASQIHLASSSFPCWLHLINTSFYHFLLSAMPARASCLRIDHL